MNKIETLEQFYKLFPRHEGYKYRTIDGRPLTSNTHGCIAVCHSIGLHNPDFIEILKQPMVKEFLMNHLTILNQPRHAWLIGKTFDISTCLYAQYFKNNLNLVLIYKDYG